MLWLLKKCREFLDGDYDDDEPFIVFCKSAWVTLIENHEISLARIYQDCITKAPGRVSSSNQDLHDDKGKKCGQVQVIIRPSLDRRVRR